MNSIMISLSLYISSFQIVAIMCQSEQQQNPIFKIYCGMKVWQLRHLFVSKFIEKHNIKSLLDLGCSTATLLQRVSRYDKIQLLVGVDIDDEAIKTAVNNVFPQPIQQDIKYRRQKPLHLKIYQADITLQHPQLKQFNCQLITMIEVIQHLQTNVVQKAVDTLFGYLNPNYIIITTPNKQFNYFFDLKHEQFRHWDHKFEWDQKQFKQFCENIKSRYSYQYEIFGVGQHVNDASKGFCTQGSIFYKSKVITMPSNQTQSIECKLIRHYIYPFWKQTAEQELNIEIIKALRKSTNNKMCIIKLINILTNTNIGKCLINDGVQIKKDYIYQIIDKNKNIKRKEEYLKLQESQEQIEDENFNDSLFQNQSQTKFNNKHSHQENSY